jgi:hemerythrin-like domain-containing protein
MSTREDDEAQPPIRSDEEWEPTTVGEHGAHGKPLANTKEGPPMSNSSVFAAGPDVTSEEPDPLKELLRFHGQIRAALQSLELLAAAPDTIEGHELERPNPRQLVEFLGGPLVWHDIDEEASLMPRLRRVKHSRHLDELLLAVTEHHERMESCIERLLPELEKASHPEMTQNLDVLAENVAALKELLVSHLALEEQHLFPFARLVLDDTDLAELAEEIRDRHDTRAVGKKAVVEV